MSEKFDVDKAIAYLETHAHTKPTHHCAKYVRLSLAAGGIILTNAPLEAKNYGSVLMLHGFERIMDLPLPQKGDIAVIQDYSGGSVEGHITMYTGKRWISDFIQLDMWGGSGYRANKPHYAIYRYKQ
jgi:type VI secretion system secreted protein VgrG